MRREILGFMVHVSCNFQDEGCTWSGEVRHFEVLLPFLVESAPLGWY